MASVRCVTYCNLYSLDSSQFESVLQSYPLMRRTMESVAAERLNKLGKNPSIISTRHDLKRDTAALKTVIDRATPQPSSDSSANESDALSNSSNPPAQKKIHFKSSLAHLHDELKRSFLNNRQTTSQRKFSSDEKKTRTFLAAPSSNASESGNQMKKSPSTPFSLFSKSSS